MDSKEKISDDTFEEWKAFVQFCAQCGRQNTEKGSVGMYKDGVKVPFGWRQPKKKWATYSVLCKACAVKVKPEKPAVTLVVKKDALTSAPGESDVQWAVRIVTEVREAIEARFPGKTFADLERGVETLKGAMS